MPSDILTSEARKENAAMLAASLGIGLSDANEALQFDVVITRNVSDQTAVAVAEELAALLNRTIRSATVDDTHGMAALEIVIGDAKPKTGHPKLLTSVGQAGAVIGGEHACERCAEIPAVLSLLVACYAAAAAMQQVFRGQLPFQIPSPLHISFGQLGIDTAAFDLPVDIGNSYLAGAGAIGNGFLWAARHMDFRGTLNVVDDDDVSSGNLNRQIWFTKTDVGLSKAERLASLAQRSLPKMRLVPRKLRLQELSERCGEPWLARLFVAVDSRRARRKIQNEFPGEVFDASTTDIREVIIHHHKQPTQGACLSCIYDADQEEFTREHHIAEHLGVSVDDVRTERVTDAAAQRIAERIPDLEATALIGIAYDTLFKQLCGEGALQTLEGRRIVAPFAFVSILAGALLALEALRRLGKGQNRVDFNYWRVSPWHPPLGRRQIFRPRQLGCEFCGNPLLESVNAALWRAA